MGAYAECWLDCLHVGSTKYDFDFRLMQLFRNSDKRVRISALKTIEDPLPGWMERDDHDEVVHFVYYSAPIGVIRDRLELQGYTLSTTKRAFMQNIRLQATKYAELIERMEDYYDNRVKLLKSVNVDKWLAALGEIKRSGRGTPTRHLVHKSGVNLESFMLEEEQWYGFSGADLYIPLRLALETCDGTENLVYDLTDLVEQGYIGDDEDCVAASSELATGEYASRSKIIVLTEGRSDAWILSESMKVLYPHLHDYFSFMDFESARVEGGASPLAKIVKSFAGAGIVNKVIAVFDNDTVGQEAMHSLRQIKLPGNISVLKLPSFKKLNKYPTIGPSGQKAMNINGSASSIELYLGEDVLKENGKFLPVQWSGYIPSMNQYQGSLLTSDKDRVHKRFKDKLEKARDLTSFTQGENWTGLREIMDAIFSAFHNFDRRIISQAKVERC
jgi:hypothetical protein